MSFSSHTFNRLIKDKEQNYVYREECGRAALGVPCPNELIQILEGGGGLF